MSIDLKERIVSPCIKVCNSNWKGLCVGCYRNILEITQWGTMSNDERKRIMSEIPKRKELYTGKTREKGKNGDTI